MASVKSQTSPRSSPYDFDSSGETGESWEFVDYSSGASAVGSFGFLPSPVSGSLASYGIIGNLSMTPPRASVSPLSLAEMDHAMFLPSDSTTFAGHHSEVFTTDAFAQNSQVAEFGQDAAFLTPQEFGLTQSGGNELTQQELMDMAPFMTDFQSDFFQATDSAAMANFTAHSQQLDTQPLFSTEPTLTTWNSEAPSGVDTRTISFENFKTSPRDDNCSAPTSSAGSSNSSPNLKPLSSSRASPSLPIRKVKAGKVEKSKSGQTGKFVIMTPNSISAQAGKPNPFECFEAMRATQKGRKGPLADEIKESALHVRRLGACFCCHSRKVKCDRERPCKHCKRLMVHVPQVVCWQFQDFLPVLFPDFIRAHFRKTEMAEFLDTNIASFQKDLYEIDLFSGPLFSAILNLQANLFTAKTHEVLQHWHLGVSSNSRTTLHTNGSAPVGIDLDVPGQRENLRKRTKTYIHDIINEPFYAEQVTDSLRSTQLPTKILHIVQAYAKQSGSPMVKRALSIYGMHYVMTRHLCITQKSLSGLQQVGLVAEGSTWMTPRVLARQVKSIIDEMIMRDMQQIFELFSKSLKPKHRREWAPCTAAFLVLCLFMEAVETTTENFVVAQTEVNKRSTSSSPPQHQYSRSFGFSICKELENMPFKQFAYQFHSIYQTHAKDAHTKSFNPLFDDSFAEQGELDGPAVEMVKSLRSLFQGDSWQDLQFLSDDGIILDRDENHAPLDSSFLYTGRLVAKFLLSFLNEHVIFGSEI